jgi:tetratricopeptide (TPR) repeat protein
MDQQLFDLARRDLEQALQIDPRNAGAHNNLAYMEYMLGNHDAGLHSCDRGIQLNPAVPNLFTTRAEIYTAQGQIERAIRDYDQAIKLNPHDHGPRIYRSLTYFMHGDIERSRADFEHVLALAPRKALLHDQLTLELKIKPNLAWAMMCLRRAAELHPDNPLVYQGRADVHRVAGALDRALEDYDRAILLAPQQARFYLARGRVHQQLGNTDRAMADFARVIDLTDAPHVRRQVEAELHKLRQGYTSHARPAEPVA